MPLHKSSFTSLFSGVLLVVMAMSCASNKREIVTWDDVGDRTKTKRATKSDFISDPVAEAKSQRTAETCIARSEEIAAVDAKKGWAIMEACLGRDDLSTVEPFVRGPWKTQIWSSDPEGRWLAKAIANRGAFLVGEKRSLSQHGIRLQTLSDAVKGKVGTVFMARAKSSEPTKGGQVVAEYSLVGDAKTDHHVEIIGETRTHWLVQTWDEVKNRVESQPTGRRVIVPPGTVTDKEVVLLLRKTGMRKVYDEDAGKKVPTVVAEVLSKHKIRR